VLDEQHRPVEDPIANRSNRPGGAGYISAAGLTNRGGGGAGGRSTGISATGPVRMARAARV